MESMVITVWRDGTWKVWRESEGLRARHDPDFLVNIDVSEADWHAGAGGTDAALAKLAERRREIAAEDRGVVTVLASDFPLPPIHWDGPQAAAAIRDADAAVLENFAGRDARPPE